MKLSHVVKLVIACIHNSNSYDCISVAKVTNLFADLEFAKVDGATKRHDDYDETCDLADCPLNKLILSPTFPTMLGHFVDASKHNSQPIVITFSKAFLLNHLVFQGFPGVKVFHRVPFSYFIELSYDGTNYYKFIDYSGYNCYGEQELFFPPQAVRYVHNLHNFYLII